MRLAVDQFCGRQWSALYTSRERTRGGEEGRLVLLLLHAVHIVQCPVPREPVIGRSANRVTDQKKTTAGRSFRMVRHESIRATIYLLSSLALVTLPRLSLSRMHHTHTHIRTRDSPFSLSPLSPSPSIIPSFFFFFFSGLVSRSFFHPCSSPRPSNLLLCLSSLLVRCVAALLFSLVSPHCKVP